MVAGLALSAVFLGSALGQIGGGGINPGPEYVARQVIVRVKPNTDLVERMFNTALRAVIIGRVNQLNIRQVLLPPNVSVEQAVTLYERQSFVEYAEPNIIQHIHYNPNDPMFASQYAHQRISTPGAWNITKGSPTVKIAIIDTGIFATHPDLQNKILPGYDFVNEDPIPEDNHGHGTHVAGDAAADTDNGVGVAGPGFNCMIIPIKASEQGGLALDDIIQSIVWAADQGAHVISMSFGGYGQTQAEEDAVNYAWNKGSVLLSSSGNDGVTQKSYPAAFENVIAVGASNQADQQAGFSNYGSDWVDVAAPGVSVLSTVRGGGYEAWDGTSMSCPVAAGVVGLLWSVAPQFTNLEIRQLLENNCDNVGNWVKYGRVNAERAVLAAPIYVTEPVPPISVSTMIGNYVAGDLSSILNYDGLTFRINTEFQRNLGAVAAGEVVFDGDPLNNNVLGITLHVNAQAANGTTGMLYLWDYSKNQYVWMKSFPMSSNSGSDTASLNFPAPFSKYVNSQGVSRVVIRAVGPQRLVNFFQFAIDRVAVDRRVRAN